MPCRRATPPRSLDTGLDLPEGRLLDGRRAGKALGRLRPQVRGWSRLPRELAAAHRALHYLNEVSRFMRTAGPWEQNLVVACLEKHTYFGDYEPWDPHAPWLKPWQGSAP